MAVIDGLFPSARAGWREGSRERQVDCLCVMDVVDKARETMNRQEIREELKWLTYMQLVLITTPQTEVDQHGVSWLARNWKYSLYESLLNTQSGWQVS